MKLTTIINPENGKTIDDDGTLDYNSLTIGLPIFLIEEIVSSGYKDISSIKNWAKYRHSLKRDYKFARERIKESYIAKGGWSNLDIEEKEIISQFFLTQKSKRDEIYSTEEQIIFGHSFHHNSVISRVSRTDKIMEEIFSRISDTSENKNIINDITGSSQILERYIKFGREGTLEGDTGSGAFDYLESRVGTEYENNGFRGHNYMPVGYNNMTEFSNYLVDILKHGNFDYND